MTDLEETVDAVDAVAEAIHTARASLWTLSQEAPEASPLRSVLEGLYRTLGDADDNVSEVVDALFDVEQGAYAEEVRP